MITDIHMHVVPGLDDGARNSEMSIAMICMAHEQGVGRIFCSTHNYGMDYGAYQEALAGLQEILLERNIGVELYESCEVLMSRQYVKDIERMLGHTIPTINHTRHVLTEFSPYIPFDEVIYCLDYLKVKGWEPVIAHAERCEFVSGETIGRVREMGCKIQVNYYSLKEEGNPEIKRRALEMLRLEMIDFLGSDAHRLNHRPPNIASGVETIMENCSRQYTERILFRNAEEHLLKR